MSTQLPYATEAADTTACAPDDPTESTILVVDDSAVSRRVVCGLLEKNGHTVATAKHGKEAMAFLERQQAAAVITDLNMPEMNGLELVEEVRFRYAQIPVILMTGCGSEKAAFQALRAGAVSYVPKEHLLENLVPILESVLKAAKIDRRRQAFLEHVTEMECRFALPSDPALVPILVAHLQDYLTRMKLCDANQRIRVGTALEEAVLNGLYHGNLELSSDLRQDGSDRFERLAATRRLQAPFRDRRVHVHVQLGLGEAVFVIRDDGAGFDVSKLPDPTDPENLVKASGRGLLLIHSFMDEAVHNPSGNELTMTWRRKAAPARRR